jgi:hypothetical protein
MMARNKIMLALEEAVAEVQTLDNTFSLLPNEPLEEISCLEVADCTCARLAEEIVVAKDARIALEAIARYLSKVPQEQFNDTSLKLANISIESICLNTNLPVSKMSFSMESYTKDPKVALEEALLDIEDKSKAIWKMISEKVSLLLIMTADKMDMVKRGIAKLEARVDKLELMVLSKEGKTALLEYTRPSFNFTNLLYSHKGFPENGTGVMADLDKLMTVHAATFDSMISRSINWLSVNAPKVAYPSKIADSFSIDPSFMTHFTMTGEVNPVITETTQAMLAACSEGQWHCSLCLPGCQAVWVRTANLNQTGEDAIDAFCSLSTAIVDHHDEQRISRFSEMLKHSRSNPSEWFSLQDNLDQSDVAFETLSLEEASKRLKEVKATLEVFKTWYSVTFGQIWKNAQFDMVCKDFIYKADTPGVQANIDAVVKLILGTLGMMELSTQDIPSYCLTTCNSLLNYVEKSLVQY